MHLKKDKKLILFFYVLIILFLTTISNYNFYNKKIFTIKHIDINGLSEKKNLSIKNEIQNIIGKNIILVKKNNFNKIMYRNDIRDITIKKIYPNKLVINFIPAKPICEILFENYKIFLGDNGKKLEPETIDRKLPIVYGSKNIKNIFKVINLLMSSNLDYYKINKIIFFKSGRFDINLDNEILIKYPINYSKEIINYSNDLFNNEKFANSKIIDLRLNNKIIKYE
tara:strand:- start:181 stop:855 length:675 start_codon:yes stop_codon:yes gene_type:complete